MKSLFLATAAVAAFAAAPALAQESVGSIGVRYANTEVDALGVSAEGDGVAIDAAFAVPVTADWTVTLDGAFGYAFDGAPNQDDSSLNGRIHASRNFGNVRIGAFAGGSEASDEQLWSFGAQAQAYMNNLTVSGSLAYETIEGADADIWSLGGDVAYFINPNFRVNGGLGWTTVDAAGVDADAVSANIGGEYQLTSGLSLTGAYTHGELDDADLSVDTVMLGVRFSFGAGDLQTRQRSGADLGRTVAGLGALAGAL
jgi:outer membrane protein W